MTRRSYLTRTARLRSPTHGHGPGASADAADPRSSAGNAPAAGARPTPEPIAIRLGPFFWLIVAALVVLWLARAVLGPFIVAAVLAYAFSPLATALQRRSGLPRVAIVGLGYLIVMAMLGLFVAVLARPVSDEFQMLASSGPDIFATAIRELTGVDSLDIAGQHVTVTALAAELRSRVGDVLATPGDALHLAAQFAEIGLQIVLALIVTFYLIVDGERFRDTAVGLLPAESRGRTVVLLGRIHNVLGKWLRGQLLLIALVATVTYLFLGPILHLPYALAIGVLTGVLEIIPLVGPIVATAVAATDAFAHGGMSLAVTVIAMYFVLRQVEDQVVMPVVIGRAVHLHPVVTIFAVLVGLATYGVLGGLLSVHVAAAANVVFEELYRQDRDEPAPLGEIQARADPTTSDPPTSDPPTLDRPRGAKLDS